MVVVLWHPVGVESPTAVGGFTGARLLAGGCGIMWELIPTAVGGFTGAGLLAGGCGNSKRNCNSWWIHRCWTVSWWLWHPVGVESPTADLGHEFFFSPPGPQLVPLYFVLLLLAEVAGEQMAQPLPYPPTGGIRLTVQQDQSPGSHRLAEEWWK